MPERVTEAITRIRRESLPQPAVPLARPRIVTPEHVVGVDDLPRGPKMVAKSIDAQTWEAVWLSVESEELEQPRRGGLCYGVKFRHRDGRYGWGWWFRGSYEAAFVWRPGGPVPQKLSAKALKELLH